MRLIQVTTSGPLLINPAMITMMYEQSNGQAVITVVDEPATICVKEKMSDILRAMSAEVHKV